MKFRWPLAWKSTSEAWEELFKNAWNRMSEGYSSAHEWSNKCKAMQDRLVEITDLERTTPEVMANVFASWDSEQQAKFINLFAEISKEWKGSRCMQFAHVMDDLTYEACVMLENLGDHAQATASKAYAKENPPPVESTV
jgi:hypothetical protein